MGLLVGFIIFMFVAFFFAVNGQNRGLSGGAGSWLVGGTGLSGTPARAILLGVSSTGFRRTYGGQRYEVRNARIDVEEPGTQPYELDTQIYIPGNLVRDALPGSTMEVRIDRSNPGTVYIVGPDVGYTQGAVRTS